MKTATILSAQKDDEAKVVCPHCEKPIIVEVEELEGIYDYDCPHCELEFRVDFDEFKTNFIPVISIKPTTHE